MILLRQPTCQPKHATDSGTYDCQYSISTNIYSIAEHQKNLMESSQLYEKAKRVGGSQKTQNELMDMMSKSKAEISSLKSQLTACKNILGKNPSGIDNIKADKPECKNYENEIMQLVDSMRKKQKYYIDKVVESDDPSMVAQYQTSYDTLSTQSLDLIGATQDSLNICDGRKPSKK